MHKIIGSIVTAVLFMAVVSSASALTARQTTGSCANGHTWVSTTWFDDNGNPVRTAGVNCDGEPYDKSLSIRAYTGGILPPPTWSGSLPTGSWQATAQFDANYNPLNVAVVGSNCLGFKYEAYW